MYLLSVGSCHAVETLVALSSEPSLDDWRRGGALQWLVIGGESLLKLTTQRRDRGGHLLQEATLDIERSSH